MKATRIASVLVSALALVALAAGSAAAEKMAGVTMPETVTVDGETLMLNGMGKREATRLDIDVYVAGLYLPEQTSDAAAILGSDEPRRLHLVFVRKVNRGDIADAFTKGFRNNVDEQTVSALRDEIETLSSWMTEMKKGGSIIFTYVPGTGTIVEVDGQRKGVIEGQEFARALFSIWLGQKPPNTKLKQGLLGGARSAG